MDYGELIAQKIEALMKIRNIKTFTDLAERSGLNSSTIDNLLNRTTKNPTIATLSLIAYGLEVDLQILLDIKEFNYIGGMPFDERKKLAERKKPEVTEEPETKGNLEENE